MGRPLRIEFPGALYHITSRGNERRKIFWDDRDRARFLRMLSDYHARHNVLYHGYVLMDNHYHLILETPRGNLLKVMHGMNSGYTGYFNRRYGRSGHLFQGRYKGILVDKDAYLLQLSRYVHLNPLRAGMVKRPEEYRWSSYPGYVGMGKEESWVEYSWVLSQFANAKGLARRRYRSYTEEALETEPENPFVGLHGQVILGREAFREKIVRHLKGERIGEGIVERKRLVEHPRVEAMIEAVAQAFDVEEQRIRDKGGRDNISRVAAIYLAHRYSGLCNEEIGSYFGGVHPTTVSKASSKLEEAIKNNRKLSKIVSGLDSRFKA